MTPAAPAFIKRLRGAPWPAVLMVFACIGVNLWYYHSVIIPPNSDEAWYLEYSCRFYHVLRNEGLIAFYRTYADSFLFKAPLIAVLPLPFYLICGPTRIAALWVNMVAMVVLSVYLYLLGRRIFSEAAGRLAVIIGMTMPMLFGLSRVLLVEYALSAAVTATFYHLLASEDLRRERHVRIIGFLGGIGLLIKTLYPAYLLGPIIEIFWNSRRSKPPISLRDLEAPVKKIVFISGAIALTWYLHNALYAVGYSVRVSFGDIAADYGPKNVFDPRVIFTYLRVLFEDGPSFYYAAAGFFAAVVLGKRSSWKAALLRMPAQNRGLLSLLAWLFIPLAVATFGVNKDIRFMTPCLPAAALLVAGGVDKLTEKLRLRPLVLAAFFFVPFNQYAMMTFGKSLFPPLSIGPLRLFKTHGNYTGPPATSGHLRQEWLVESLNEIAGGKTAVIAFGADIASLNMHTLNYLSAQRDYRIKFTNYGYEYRRIELTVARLRDKGVDYLVLINGKKQEAFPENVQHLDPQVRELIRIQKLPFEHVRDLPLSRDTYAAVYRRTGEIRPFGAPFKAM